MKIIRAKMSCAGIVTLPSIQSGARGLAMKKSLDHGHRFPFDIIKLTVWIYGHFTLSLGGPVGAAVGGFLGGIGGGIIGTFTGSQAGEEAARTTVAQ